MIAATPCNTVLAIVHPARLCLALVAAARELFRGNNVQQFLRLRLASRLR
eukprot:SAG31_NODE_581_length_13927_cov_78.549899_15_plen_50_part_00